MKKIEFAAQVDVTKCTGCKACTKFCPTCAISVVDKKAEVDEGKCIFCSQCVIECPEGAMMVSPRVEALTMGVNPSEVDQGALRELCVRAHLDPEEHVCVCKGTLAKEAASAVLKGARTPEAVSLMTGARSGCGMWCNAPIQRLLEAHGIELIPPEDHRWYKVETALWNVPKEVREKYPEYFLEEDKQLFESGVLENLATIFLAGRKAKC